MADLFVEASILANAAITDLIRIKLAARQQATRPQCPFSVAGKVPVEWTDRGAPSHE
jgi:hypothetical protein